MARPTELRSMAPTRSRMCCLTCRPRSRAATQRPLAAHEAAGHLVDGADGGDGQAAFDGLDDAVVVVDVELVAGLDEDDAGADALGVGDHGAGVDAEGLGLVAGGDAAGGVGHHGDHGDGPAAQLGAGLLLDGGEVGVEIDEEPVQRGILRGISAAAPPARGAGYATGRAQIREFFGPLLRMGENAGLGRRSHLRTIFAFYSLFCKEVLCLSSSI